MNNDVMILNQYPPEKYNSLIPITTIQQVSDMHKIIVNQVMLDINEDAYKDKGKYPLKKQAILKLMAAANIRIVESKPLQTQSFKEAMEMSRAIGKQCDYDKRDVAHQITLEVPDTNGGYRYVIGTKEIVFADLPQDNQTNEILKHKRAHCETKALLRALRSAMMLKAAYEANDFKKPFIVAIVVPNSDNADVKKIMLDKFAKTSGLLFGTNEDTLSLTNNFDDSLDDNMTDVEIIDNYDDLPDILKDHFCSDCGQEITDTAKRSRDEFINYSLEHYDVELCNVCINQRAKD